MNRVEKNNDHRTVLEVKDLSLTIGAGAARQILKSINFKIDKGETVALVGGSGSGKSMTSLALMGLTRRIGARITSGQAMFHGTSDGPVDLFAQGEAEMAKLRGKSLSMIFQEPMTALNPVLSIGYQLIETIRRHKGLDFAAARAVALRSLDLVRIPNSNQVLQRYPHELSGGMRQRVMIAMAISCDPALLIADEPTTALDATVQSVVLDIIMDLQRDLGVGVLFITHDMGVVASIADRVCVMSQGEIVEQGGCRELLSSPSHDYTKTLIAAVPRIGDVAQFPGPVLSSEVFSNSDVVASTVLGNDDAPLLSVRGLVTRFPVRTGVFGKVSANIHAVESVSFDLKAGETISIIGESGSGKTTTGRTIAGLVSAHSGQVSLDGTTVNFSDRRSMRNLRQNIQFVFQDPFASLNPKITVGEAVAEPMVVQGRYKWAEALREASSLLDTVGLPAKAIERYPHEFSGGQRQRICIARALGVRPKIIVADEPVSALDVAVQAQIVDLLISLQREYKTSFVFISHDMSVVERISHRVAVMYNGQIVEIGPRQQVFGDPRHPYTRRLLQSIPKFQPGVKKPRAEVDSDLPTPIRPKGYQPIAAKFASAGAEHFYATHSVGGGY